MALKIRSTENEEKHLPSGYSIREMSKEEFDPLWNTYRPQIFEANILAYRPPPHLAPEDVVKLEQLNRPFQSPDIYTLRLGVFFKGEFCGWHIGDQTSGEVFYMRNSAVLPAHRNKGLYSALLHRTAAIVRPMGFQKIFSTHHSTNNTVIIPKLKAGFVITALQISEIFGVLVTLTLFLNPLSKEVADFRVGYRPSEQVKSAIKI